MFFYYCFTNKFGYDQVCWDTQEFGKAGDLLESNGSHYIALGSSLTWQEQYSLPGFQFPISNVQIIRSILHKKTLELIHRMVYNYYTSYRSVMGLFIGDLGQYLKTIQKTKTLTGKEQKKFSNGNNIVDSSGVSLTWDSKIEISHNDNYKQTLVVFPDLLSLKYRCNDNEYILTSQDTHHKIMKYFYDLQQGYKNILITTGANIYMDRKKLDQIICYFPQTWYYKAQQDPRVFVPEIVEKMAEIRKAKLEYIDLQTS